MHKIVPIEPTEEMIKAWKKYDVESPNIVPYETSIAGHYKAMLSAAPDVAGEAVACPFPCGWKNMTKYAHSACAFLARSTVDEKFTEAEVTAIHEISKYLLKTLYAINSNPQPDRTAERKTIGTVSEYQRLLDREVELEAERDSYKSALEAALVEKSQAKQAIAQINALQPSENN